MRALVTGVAGFIGSTIADALLSRGDEVIGVDCFTPYYDRRDKEANLTIAREFDRFQFVETDLRRIDISSLVDDVDVVFHQSAQAGVRLSWSDAFADYEAHNVLATQRLLEAAKRAGGPRFIYASSSSVYGNAVSYPTSEEALPRPHSPYGVTKLAGEHLCNVYAENWGVPTVALRYFTVYGPRQRPDMALHRLFESALSGQPFPLYGDGSAIRDFTYVGDVVRANLAAAVAECAPGTVVNVAGGGSISMRDLIKLVGELAGRRPTIEELPKQSGDVARTGGAVDRAYKLLGWTPETDLQGGLAAQALWHQSQAR